MTWNEICHSPQALHCGLPSSSLRQSGVVLVPQLRHDIPAETVCAGAAGGARGNVVVGADGLVSAPPLDGKRSISLESAGASTDKALVVLPNDRACFEPADRAGLAGSIPSISPPS